MVGSAVNRRRFIGIVAGVVAAGPSFASSPVPTRWRGIALGAEASITLVHPDADGLVARAVAEIDRLEAIFSLYREGSALSKLNASGRLANPPFELLELLSVCAALHRCTGGMFDPTVQLLWRLYAERYAAGSVPTEAEITNRLVVTGWHRIAFSDTEVSIAPGGGALTLNGVAQGYIADRVAMMLRQEGVTDVLVNMGEISANGSGPDGDGWPLGVASADRGAADRGAADRGTVRWYRLRNAALATSMPQGTVFDAQGRVGHILNPTTGRPGGVWSQVTVVAPSAALADGLSTAF